MDPERTFNAEAAEAARREADEAVAKFLTERSEADRLWDWRRDWD